MADFQDFAIPVTEKLSLHMRYYNGGAKSPVICLHGLTRNCADFEELAPRIAAAGHDVHAVSFRGRGRSDHDPDYLNYHPLTYRDDVLKVMDVLSLPEAILVGTSLGGITTMLVNEAAPERVKAAIINDIGPELAPEGIARIISYVGTDTAKPSASLEEAAARVKATNSVAFPDATNAEWLKFARRTFRETGEGWLLDYDPNIAKAMAEAGPTPDLWAPFESLKNKPTLVIRGGISDLLSPEIIAKMRNAHAGFDYVEVPNIGHAPMMTEPAAWDAIERFLARVD